MGRHQVFSDSPAGGDRVWLGTIGQITGLQWSWSWPGGPEKASFKFWRDARYNHRALTQGRTIGICVGAGKHVTGILSRPGRGNPWEIEVDGMGVVGNNYIAEAFDPFDLDAVVDAAITRGLPWTRITNMPTGIGDRSSGGGDAQRLSVAGALSKVLPETGQSWHINPDGGAIVLDTLPTTPTHLLLTADPARGRTVADYVSAYLVVYNDSASGKVQTTWVRSTPAENVRPPVEEILDLTGRGQMTGTQARVIAGARLTIKGQRAPFADSFTFAHGMVRNLYGTPVDLASLKLPMLARLMLTDPDHPAETSYAAATDLLIRRITYFDDTDTVELEPLDLTSSDLKSLLGSASAPTADGGGSGGRRNYGPQLLIHNSANQNATTGATLTVSFNTVDEDNTGGSMFTSGTTVTILTDGWYSVRFSCEFAANATGFRQCHIFRSGVGVVGIDNKPAVNGGTTKLNAVYEGPILAAQQLTFGALQNSGGTLALLANNNSPQVSVKHLGPLH